MSQSSVINSSQSSDSQLPEPLKAVLGCLDVQLEDELSRYRRYRRAQTPPPPAKPSASYTQKPSEVLSVSEGENNIEPSSVPSGESNSSGSKSPRGWESVIVPESAPLALRMGETELQSKTNQPRFNRSSFASSSSPKGQSEGYLESSQNLVKSLEERRARRRRHSWAASLFTPVGIGSMLLFLLSCIGLGYVVMSPSGMATLGLNRWFKFNQTAETPEEVPDADSVAPQPDLTAREFVDLELNTLSNINPSPSPIPTPPAPSPAPAEGNGAAPPSPQSSGPGMNNLTNELLPEPVPPTPKSAPAAAPTVTPTPAAAPTVSPTPPAGAGTRPNSEPLRAEDNLYYVVTSYTDERSLEQVREVVPDAYVREFKTGVKVQMGALDNSEAAKQLAEELRVQGISVQFDTPKTTE